MRARGRRHPRRPPDLTSLFDVLFIVVFVALIRAASAQQEVQRLTAPPPPKPATPAPLPPPPDVIALRAKALANLEKDLEGRTPLVIRVSVQETSGRMTDAFAALELGGQKLPLDVPLLADSTDQRIERTYQGARSAELRLCRLAAVHLQLPDLSRHLVIVVTDRARADLEAIYGSEALLDGLEHDVKQCFSEQRGIAALLDPSELAPSVQPPTSPPAPSPP